MRLLSPSRGFFKFLLIPHSALRAVLGAFQPTLLTPLPAFVPSFKLFYSGSVSMAQEQRYGCQESDETKASHHWGKGKFFRACHMITCLVL